MKEYKNVYLYATLRNCVSIICFTLLAMHFDKWWIALFSALFLCDVKWERV